MTDRFGRDITYLRLSVTDLCNLRCKYCMPAEGITKRPHRDILSIEEIEELVSAAAQLGIKKVRITGGEPLVRRGIVDICRRVAGTPGISETCMTTNGTLLGDFAALLRDAGVSRLNISLDTLNPAQYREITRGGELATAIYGIKTAREAGFDNIKINAVLMRGENDGEIRKLVDLTRDSATHLRFIELMPVGSMADFARQHFLDNYYVLSVVPELTQTANDGVARCFKLPGAMGTVGLISPVSSHFCPSCNRIRITADGRLKPCLHSADEVTLRGLHGAELLETMYSAIFNKPQRHHIDRGTSDSTRDMYEIGG